MKQRLEVMNAIVDCLKKLHLRPPSQVNFITVANTSRTACYSRQELLTALYALEGEGVIALHHDNSFSILKPASAI